MTWKVANLEELAKMFEQFADNEDHKVKRYLKTVKEKKEAEVKAFIWRDAAKILRDTVIEPK